MTKPGLVLCAAIAALVFGVAATRSDDSAAKLEEIRALLAENNRLQRLDLHPRLYKDHAVTEKCDFSRGCRKSEDLGSFHRAEVAIHNYRHPFGGDCGTQEGCKKAEESLLEAIRKYGK